MLGNAGLPMVDDVLATTAHYAGEAASRMEGPVAMKIVSPDIRHKTEIGGVILGIESAQAAEAAFISIMDNVVRHAPDARIDGVLISPMISGGVECILGAKIDPVFGAVVMFGLGGVLTEVLKDVAFRRAPFGPDVAGEMIDELKGAAILKGARGRAPADLDALADAISKLSLFAAANAGSFESVEMNPICALPDRCLALDALIVARAN